MRSRSESLFANANNYMPGGVNSPERAFGSVEIDPIYIERGSGSRLYDVDGTEYIDYSASWGSLILGHADERVVMAISEAAASGTSFGANTEREVEFADLISSIYPSVELIRMVSSATEATMSAIRLARAYTHRDRIVKFEGCDHGHGDSFLARAGSEVLGPGIPGSPGITGATAADTLLAEFNNLDSVRACFEGHPEEISALVVEPIMGNAGVIPPADYFLQGLRDVTTEFGSLLIFDEVMTGFRVALGGAQELYKVEPDLTCMGKIIGGGLPVGAFGGKREYMQHMAPLGSVYQAGSLSGNPLVLAAGLATVEILRNDDVYDRLEHLSTRLETGIRDVLMDLGLPYDLNRVGSMMCLFFTDGPVNGFADAVTADTEAFNNFYIKMIEGGIYFPPSAYEPLFISGAHTENDIDKTVEVMRESLRQ